MATALPMISTHAARAALDLVENAIVVTERGGTIVFVNSAFTRITGYSAEEAVGSNPRLLRSGAQEPGFYRDMWTRILSGEVWDGEIVNRRKDGTRYTDRMTITPLIDATGAITHFVAVKRDVSTHLAELTAGSPSGTAHLDSTARLVYANPALEGLLGRPFDELLGHGWLQPLVAGDRAAMRDELQRLATGTGADRLLTVRARGHVGGDTTTLRVHLAPLRFHGGDVPAAGVVANFEDVSEEEHANERLRNSERFATAVLDSLGSPTAVIDRHGVIRQVNQVWRRQAHEHGVDDASGPGADYLEVCRRSAALGCSDADAAGRAIAAVLDGGVGAQSIDYRMAPDGPWWELRITSLRTAEGGAVLVHQDVSTRHDLADLLAREARTDVLTGLHNRTGLADLSVPLLARAERSGRPVTVMFLDLDDFKPINDEHGHEAGDHVLREVAKRLSATARGSDVVARVGGDEFVLLIEELERPVTGEVADRFAAAVEAPIELPDGTRVRVGASIGLVTSMGTELDELLHAADDRMYAQKRRRGGEGMR